MNIFAILFVLTILLTYLIAQLLSINNNFTDIYHWTFSASISDNKLFSNIMFIIAYTFYISFFITTFDTITIIFFLGLLDTILSIIITYVPLKFDNEKPHITIALFLFLTKLIISIMFIFKYANFSKSYKIKVFIILCIFLTIFAIGIFNSKSLAYNDKKNNIYALLSSIFELLFNLVTFYILLKVVQLKKGEQYNKFFIKYNNFTQISTKLLKFVGING